MGTANGAPAAESLAERVLRIARQKGEHIAKASTNVEVSQPVEPLVRGELGERLERKHAYKTSQTPSSFAPARQPAAENATPNNSGYWYQKD